MAGIFINYRRDDAPGVAGRLGDRLAKNFSQREIFMDVDAMKPGLDFVKQLDEQVSKCDVVLAIIGPNWLNAADEKGRRKLELPRDYVRVELASALKREIPVIPLLVNGAAMPLEDDLPDDLKSLANRHALELRHTRFVADSEAIVHALNGIMPRAPKWWRIAAGAALAGACVLGAIVFWSSQNEHFALSGIFQNRPAEKVALTQETRTVPSVTPAPKSPTAASTEAPAPKPTQTSTPAPAPATAAAPAQNSAPVAPSVRSGPTGDKRVALIVGNSNYQTVPQLRNPARDATSMAKLFGDAGFDSIDLQVNVGIIELKRAIRKFQEVAYQADVAVIYYSGHGIEIAGTNYLIPTDAKLAIDRDVDDEAIPLERLVSSIDGARRLRLVILDACRNNPFAASIRHERKSATSPSVGGLGKVEPTSADTLIAYAARAGSTTEDGDGEHSPFTTALLKNLAVPGLDVRLAFGRIKDEVMKATAKRQEPFVYGSLGGSNYALVPAPTGQQMPANDNDIKSDYELVEKVGTVRAWQVFLGSHPTGFYSDLARAQLTRVLDQPTKAP
jgi:hypothetical protein